MLVPVQKQKVIVWIHTSYKKQIQIVYKYQKLMFVYFQGVNYNVNRFTLGQQKSA